MASAQTRACSIQMLRVNHWPAVVAVSRSQWVRMPRGMRGSPRSMPRPICPTGEQGVPRGLPDGDIATEIGYEVPNTHSTLQALERAGLVELVPASSPQRWRLAPRYRATAGVFMRVASRVREGEWTTYGDISIAVRGDTKAARGVGRAAAAVPGFPHPERVLMDGGIISPHWHDAHGGPERCQRLLDEQGVRFIDDQADPAQRVAWDELRRRDEAEPVDL